MSRRWLAVLAVALLVACGCGNAHPSHKAGVARRGHVIDLLGKKQPPLLPELTAAQAARLPKLHVSLGPVYQHGRVLGVAVRFGGCEHPMGAVVTETATTVTVTVYGPRPSRSGACSTQLLTGPWAVRLPHPLGHRTETKG